MHDYKTTPVKYMGSYREFPNIDYSTTFWMWRLLFLSVITAI